MMPPVPTATREDRAMIRPALAGSLTRNSATCLVAVRPRPKPANMPNIPTVLWMMPSSPKPSFPSIRATRIEDTRPNPREIAAPASDQKAPLARRYPTGEALTRDAYLRRNGGNMAMMALAALKLLLLRS